jgi:hypothetical protein
MYRTIDARFWSDPKVRKLTVQAKFLFFYLVTNPHTHVSGIYYLTKGAIVEESGLPKAALDTLCDTLTRAGLARFDRENHVVWVKNMMRYQGKGDKNTRSAAFHLNDLHNSCLIKEFLAEYPAVQHYVKIPHQSPIQQKADHATPEQEQEQEQEQDNTPPTPKGECEEISAAEFLTKWNQLGPPFKPIVAMTKDRCKKLRARSRDRFWREHWCAALALLPDRPFLRGDGERGWIADVDFFLRPDTVVKIEEGKYQAVNGKPVRKTAAEMAAEL